MNDIIAHLQESIADELFSKVEKRTLKEMVANQVLTPDQLNFLRSKVYELANEKATATNYKFILEWIKNANSALTVQPRESSEAFFSPGEACRDAIIHQIKNANSQINICVFTISDDRISEVIMASHKAGKDIKIITDNDKSHDLGSDVERMANEGISIKMDRTANHMHHKFMVVDNRLVLTGSYNWTQSAARYNYENIMLSGSEVVVKSFQHEFDKLWNEMENYQ